MFYVRLTRIDSHETLDQAYYVLDNAAKVAERFASSRVKAEVVNERGAVVWPETNQPKEIDQ